MPAETVPAEYGVRRAPHSEFPTLEAITLSSPDDLSVTFIPSAGMVGSSLVHRGEEILGMRAGLGAYLESGKTFGIPLLAPWANRLVADTFDGTTLVTDGIAGAHLDANGLPIHGLLAGCPDWVVTRAQAANTDNNDQRGAYLVAELDFNAARPEFPAWPFPHLLKIAVRLVGTTVQITTAVTATSEVAVPIAFGWHPYFAPPGSDRADWTVASPFTHHLVLDKRFVPTGEVERVPVSVAVLGDPQAGGITLDDLYCEVPDGTTAWLEGSQRRITLRYDSGYPYAVLFAPPDQALVAIEPMTAPTDPLAGNFPIRTAAPGQTAEAIYSIVVTESGVPG